MNGAHRGRPGGTAEQLLERARASLQRLAPEQARAAAGAGRLLIDIRSEVQRERAGVLPGSRSIARNVLEWRCDAVSPWRDRVVADARGRVIVIRNEGYQSSLAAATIQQFGLLDASGVIGGFQGLQSSRATGAGARGRSREPGHARGGDPTPRPVVRHRREPHARDDRPVQLKASAT